MYGPTVADVMTKLVVALRPGDGVEEAARRLVHNAISGAPVVNGSQVIGIVSRGDVLRAMAEVAPAEPAYAPR